jgi:DNA-binding SARP family transcriptional activator
VEVGVLGPVGVVLDGRAVDLGTPKQRALVAALALSRGWPVSVDAIVDLLWADAPPPGVTATLQAYVSQLRRVLEPERARRAPATVLVTVAPGYALRVPDEAVDAHLFEQAVTAEHHRLGATLLGPPSLTGPELTEVRERIDLALGRWRGTPYAELGDAPAAVAERARLEELRTVGLEARTVAALALGRHTTVAAELEALTAAYPLRERLWALRALALTRAGRQADALEVLRGLRQVLDEELGIEPSVELRDLQTAVLRQDSALDWVAPDLDGHLDGHRHAQPVAQPVATRPADAQPADAQPAGGPPPAAPPVGSPWPTVGRDEELALLGAALSTAEAGTPSFAVLTGEPGIGKSRLAGDLVALARSRGHRVLVGRCSQDDGAPPLWPWRAVLTDLGQGGDQPDAEAGAAELEEGESGQFRAWERITRTVRAAAALRPTVLVLDDLHWADTSTLRVLRLLAETAAEERLLVLATWRRHPEPTGALADVAEALGRRHAVRLELDGLPEHAVAAVVAGVSDLPVTPDQARALRARTDGNPFFLVEYARLAGGRSGLDELLHEDDPPTAVSEVVARRLARLPDETARVLRTAAVVGREFDTPTLAAASDVDEDDLLDVVEPAQVAGLVREDGVDRFRFAHALVRDTLRSSMRPSRRARVHARVAGVLADRGGRETEVALHWLAAGPAHAPQAWRAALRAGEVARGLHAYEELVDLLRAALSSLDGDPGASGRDRYEVLTALIDAYRWSALLPDLVASVEAAIAVARELDDAEAVARAAIAATQGVLWRSAPPGEVNPLVVDALRTSLDRLPAVDGELRCRTLLALANELEHRASLAERRALVDEGLAMARRLGDRRLVRDACQVAFVALWVMPTAEERLALASESMELCAELGDERGFVVSATLRTVVLGELGRRREMLAAADVARAEARRLRIFYGELVLDSAELPWQAMAGRFERCEELMDRVRAVSGRIAHSFGDEALAGAVVAYRLWDGHALDALPVLEEMNSELYRFDATITVHLWRGGERARARAWHADRGAPLESRDPMMHLLQWCHAAEAALYVGDRELAARVYPLLAPFAGRSCSVGSSMASGPVDAYLGLAAAATGERMIAGGHAEDAAVLAREWELPLFGRWLAGLRDTYAF